MKLYNNVHVHTPTVHTQACANTRINIKDFLLQVFNTLHPTKKMISNWHLDLMLEYLKNVEKGTIKRLIVNLPPRSLKSICINVAWVAWVLGHAPHTRIITVSYNQELSEKHAIDCRFIMQSEWYKKMFPNTIIARGSNTKNKFTTTQKGFRLATSTGGTLTGEGADIIIIDDPLSASDIFSYKRRQKSYEWFRSCLLSRLNDTYNGKILLVMQRLHAEDLTGLILKNDIENSWKILKISAIATMNHEIKIGDFIYFRKNGEHLYDNAKLLTEYGDELLSTNIKLLNYYLFSCFNTTLNSPLLTTIMPNNNLKHYDFKINNHYLLWYDKAFYFFEYTSKYIFEFCKTSYIYAHKVPNYSMITDKYIAHPMIDSMRIQGVNSNFNLVQNEVGEGVFNIQYQQETYNSEYAIIKSHWLYKDNNLSPIEITDTTMLSSIDTRIYDDRFDYIYQSWDCAVKAGNQHDYSVCSSWGVKYNKLYLLNILRLKMNYPKLRKTLIDMALAFKPDAILIEDCASGQQLIQEMNEINSTIKVIAIRPKSDKMTRLTLASPLFEQHMVVLPSSASWLNVLTQELLNFPNVEYDDQVDSMTQFLNWYQKNEALKQGIQKYKLFYKLNSL